MSDRDIVDLRLSDITVSHNPRNPARQLSVNLLGEGFPEGTKILDLVHKLALSDDPHDRERFVELMEKYEWRDPQTGDIDPESIVELAKSLLMRQIEPIMVRDFRVLDRAATEANGSNVYVTRYGLVVGERRTIATAYNYAKSGVPAVVRGVVVKLTVGDAEELAWAENRRRKQPTELEVGEYFHAQLERRRNGPPHPKTGKKWTMKQVAEEMREDYQDFRRKEALHYLDEPTKRRLEAGLIGVTVAVQKALVLKSGKPDATPIEDRRQHRRRVLTLREVEALFDKTSRAKTTYLQALADVMSIDLETAIRESDARLAESSEAA